MHVILGDRFTLDLFPSTLAKSCNFGFDCKSEDKSLKSSGLTIDVNPRFATVGWLNDFSKACSSRSGKLSLGFSDLKPRYRNGEESIAKSSLNENYPEAIVFIPSYRSIALQNGLGFLNKSSSFMFQAGRKKHLASQRTVNRYLNQTFLGSCALWSEFSLIFRRLRSTGGLLK